MPLPKEVALETRRVQSFFLEWVQSETAFEDMCRPYLYFLNHIKEQENFEISPVIVQGLFRIGMT